MSKQVKILVLVLIFVVSLTSCQKVQVEYNLAEFESEVTVKINDLELKGSLNYVSPTQITFKIQEPKEISGLTLEIIDGEKRFKFEQAVLQSSDVDNLFGSGNVLTNLFEALGSIGNETFLIDEVGKIELIGECAVGGYNMTFDCETKRILTIGVQDKIYIFS